MVASEGGNCSCMVAIRWMLLGWSQVVEGGRFHPSTARSAVCWAAEFGVVREAVGMAKRGWFTVDSSQRRPPLYQY